MARKLTASAPFRPITMTDEVKQPETATPDTAPAPVAAPEQTEEKTA